MFEKPEKGVWSRKTSDKWQDGYFVGNGETGGILYGGSTQFNIVVNHHSLYLKSDQMDSIPDIFDCLNDLRRTIKEQGYQKGIDFFEKEAIDKGYDGLTMSDLFHPGGEIVFSITPSVANPTSRYIRSLDYETGMICEAFSTENGQEFSKKMFASKKENALYIELKSDDMFSMEFSLKEFDHSLLSQRSQLTAKSKLEAVYTYFNDSYYKVSIEWDTDGEFTAEDNTFSLKKANRLRMKVAVNSDQAAAIGTFEDIEKEHIDFHRNQYNQVSLNLCKDTDRNKSYEDLVELLESEESIPVSLYEKLYDASRYFIQSMSGPALPNLQGIWSGDFNPPWSGDFTFDTNVQLAIASLASLGLFENFSGLFNTVKAYEEDFRKNAQCYYGCRGFLVPVHASTRALHVHWNKEWPLIFWTAGAGWLAHFYNEYYDYTQDIDFLKKVALPFYEETLLFYEDFIEYEDDTAVFRPSYSAENGMGNNSTMDVAVVKATISYLKNAYKDLGMDVPDKYDRIENSLPAYMIDEEGVLKEWIDESAEENPNHRHFSNLYPVFQTKEITADQPGLWKAAHKAFDKRLEAWLLSDDGDTSSSHGRMHAAMCAIAMERSEDLEKALGALVMNQSFFPSLATSHYNHQTVFNVDANGSFPKVIHDALIYSEEPGVISLFKAVPSWLKKGTLKGIRLPNTIKVESFTWDIPNHTFELALTSKRSNTLTILLPDGFIPIEEDTPSFIEVNLKANDPVRISS
jgi:hypothetical protein